jgi:hypothetical protein
MSLMGSRSHSLIQARFHPIAAILNFQRNLGRKTDKDMLVLCLFQVFPPTLAMERGDDGLFPIQFHQVQVAMMPNRLTTRQGNLLLKIANI